MLSNLFGINFLPGNRGNDDEQCRAAIIRVVRNSTLSMEDLCGRDVSPVLLRLSVSSHPALTAAGIDLLMAGYCRFAALRTALSEVQLLVSPSTVAAFGLVRLLSPKLEALIETGEMWLGMETQDDRRCAQRVRDVITQLTDIMWIMEVEQPDQLDELKHDLEGQCDSIAAEWDLNTGLRTDFRDINASLQTILAVAGDEQIEFTYVRVDKERQLLLQNMGIAKLVIALVRQGSSMLTNRQNSECNIHSFVQELFHIFSHCYRCAVFKSRTSAPQH